MAAILIVAVIAALGRIKHVCGTPTPNTYAHPSNGICTDYTITEEVSFNNLIWGLPEFQNSYDVSGFLFNQTRKDAINFLRPFAGSENVTKTFTLSGTFCTPSHPTGGKESTVLLATHGLWYDRRYWASSFRPDEYNFAQHALENGYSIFYYDRLGTGKSEIISGYENSVFGQIELIAQMARKIRAGSYTSNIAAKKVVLVGHSFGSYASHATISRYPDLVDGAVLTGISYGNASADPFPGAASSGTWLLTAFAIRLANTDGHTWERTGYFDFADIYSHTHTFFKEPYDIPTIEFAHSIHQPGGALEFLSLSGADLTGKDFKGSVFITTGENDLLACGGNCTISYYATGQQDTLFSRAKVVETYLHPNAGHGTNFAANATGFFGEIVSFLNRNI